MTNNAKANQTVAYTQLLLGKIFSKQKTEIPSHNIIVLESPPSLNFDIFPYNQAMYHMCQNSQVFFAWNLIQRYHIKPDGLHIRNQFKRFMIMSVSAPIKKLNPYYYYGLPFSFNV